MTRRGEPVGRRLIGGVARGLGALRRRPRPGLRILMYHAIGLGDRFAVDADGFAHQMAWLREDSGLTVSALADAVADPPAPRTTVAAITFDDGYRSVLMLGAPILVRRKLPFTVFVIGEYLRRPPVSGQYLDVSALRELAALPDVTIGAHGYTHRPLTRLDDVALREDLRRSVDALSDALGRRPGVMSYPHGAMDRRVVRFVRDAGFDLAATSLLGVNRARTASLELRRTEVDAFDDDESFAGKVHGDYDWYQLKQRLYWPVPALESLNSGSTSFVGEGS